MTRAVAWDIDGTLVDSEGLHHAVLMSVSARHGVCVAADDHRFVGVAMDQVWAMLAPDYPSDLPQLQWEAQLTATYLARAAQLFAFPGALETLSALQRAGIRQCCASNSVRAIVDANLAAIGARPFVEFAISRDDVARGKPDPEPYLEACRRLQLAPAEVLVVEDSETGMAAGLAAGCQVMRFGAQFAGYDQVLARVLGARV